MTNQVVVYKGTEITPLTFEHLYSDNTIDENKTVDGRKLHKELDVDTNYTDWMKRQIEYCEFEDGKDYTFVRLKNEKNRMAYEYYISENASKELCMLARNDKGKLLRKYFIFMERVAKESTIPNHSEALIGWGEALKAKQLAEKQNREQAIHIKHEKHSKAGHKSHVTRNRSIVEETKELIGAKRQKDVISMLKDTLNDKDNKVDELKEEIYKQENQIKDLSDNYNHKESGITYVNPTEIAKMLNDEYYEMGAWILNARYLNQIFNMLDWTETTTGDNEGWILKRKGKQYGEQHKDIKSEHTYYYIKWDKVTLMRNCELMEAITEYYKSGLNAGLNEMIIRDKEIEGNYHKSEIDFFND